MGPLADALARGSLLPRGHIRTKAIPSIGRAKRASREPSGSKRPHSRSAGCFGHKVWWTRPSHRHPGRRAAIGVVTAFFKRRGGTWGRSGVAGSAGGRGHGPPGVLRLPTLPLVVPGRREGPVPELRQPGRPGQKRRHRSAEARGLREPETPECGSLLPPCPRGSLLPRRRDGSKASANGAEASLRTPRLTRRRVRGGARRRCRRGSGGGRCRRCRWRRGGRPCAGRWWRRGRRG